MSVVGEGANGASGARERSDKDCGRSNNTINTFARLSGKLALRKSMLVGKIEHVKSTEKEQGLVSDRDRDSGGDRYEKLKDRIAELEKINELAEQKIMCLKNKKMEDGTDSALNAPVSETRSHGSSTVDSFGAGGFAKVGL